MKNVNIPIKNEPRHDKNKQSECAPSEDSDQPGHPPSLISLHCALNGYLRTQAFVHADREGSDQTGWMPRLI